MGRRQHGRHVRSEALKVRNPIAQGIALGIWPHDQPSPEGAQSGHGHSDCAPSGLCEITRLPPRAMPWAVGFRPFRAAGRYIPAPLKEEDYKT